jgi:arylsulfatase A-like enzyme
MRRSDTPRRSRPSARALLAAGACLLPAVAGCGGEAPGPNLVVITLDTVRADHLGCYGYPLPTSPAVDALAEQGVLFAQAYAPMPQTLPSHATLFTGLPPRRHGALENAYVMDGAVETLAQRLAARGYETAAFIGARILDDSTGIERGFEVYDLPTGQARDRQHPVERRADAVTDSALSWTITRHLNGKPFLLWAHYYDAHGPWEPAAIRIPFDVVREEVRGRRDFESLPERGAENVLGQDIVARMWHRYDNEIAEVDAQVARLLRGLGQRGLLEDTIVVIVGDHGEGLMEHDERGHGVNVFQELMLVPLVVVLPGGELAGTRVDVPVQLEDVLPMLLSLLDAEPADGLPGRDVLPDLRAGRAPAVRPIFVERPHYSPGGDRYRRALKQGWGFGELTGVVLGKDKFVSYPDGSVQLFDLEQDPEELVDLSAERPEVAERLEDLLATWRTSLPVKDFGGEQAISEERRMVLEALGYLGGDTTPEGPASR